jgi:phage tail protein X
VIPGHNIPHRNNHQITAWRHRAGVRGEKTESPPLDIRDWVQPSGNAVMIITTYLCARGARLICYGLSHMAVSEEFILADMGDMSRSIARRRYAFLLGIVYEVNILYNHGLQRVIQYPPNRDILTYPPLSVTSAPYSIQVRLGRTLEPHRAECRWITTARFAVARHFYSARGMSQGNTGIWCQFNNSSS